MSITIYTYRDPYKLDQEPYWDEVRTCPYFCVSQTMVNGLQHLYGNKLPNGRMTTVQNLTDTMYERWESTACIVKQHTDLDNIISSSLSQIERPDIYQNVVKAFLFNREEVFKSIRIMFELNISISDILIEKLTPEQRIIVEVYKCILLSEKKNDFVVGENFDESSINNAIEGALKNASKQEVVLSDMPMDRIVIHGVHQFSPIMLRAIEQIARYKKVILLFNYQPQYQNVYQTWVDIYSAFDCAYEDFKGEEFHPSMQYPVSYKGNVLADNLGKLINGQTSSIAQDQSYEILEFDNMTEFAGYVANIFECAERVDPNNPMRVMKEQIYAADSSANNILKIYFPEQFGERQFLDYPLGHFFLAIANMWDAASNGILITDINDIKECLEAGILKESYPGQLSTIWGKISALFEGAASIEEMTQRLRHLAMKQRYIPADKKEYTSHISYFNASTDEIKLIEKALNELKDLAALFYEDFEDKAHNFREFYRKLKRYLQTEILEAHELEEEFSDIIRRVLERLEEVENIDASASFECLKATMSIYLVQETKPGKSANWIVRPFEQIDGDIMRSLNGQTNGQPIIYHFACLTDEDINAVQRANFPWPLTDDFFEVAQEPVDWKYQVYVKSRQEYKNFKRYALLYGLEFNRAQFKLSYVKRDSDREREPYYLLQMLGVRKRPYVNSRTGRYTEDVSSISAHGVDNHKFNEYDYYRYRICKYRFLLESILEGTTIYKDPFLLVKYLEVLLENEVKEELQGAPFMQSLLIDTLTTKFDELQEYFPFVLNVNRMDVINNIRSRLDTGKNKRFPILTPEDRQYMMIRELFIHKQLSDPKTFRNNILADKFPEISESVITETLSSDKLDKMKYRKNVDLWCQYCSNREFCAAYYAKSEV